jgi:organic hydroperoxide reductase OsmC/OhrA
MSPPDRAPTCTITRRVRWRVALDLDAPGIDPAEAASLMERAHQVCPYSRATRGNLHVTLTVAGVESPQHTR